MMPTLENDSLLNVADDLISHAKKMGADHAEVILIKSTDTSIDIRSGQVENSGYSDSVGVGVRVLINGQTSSVSGSDLSPHALNELVSRAVGIAKYVPHDKYADIAPVNMLEKNPNYDLGCYDADLPSLDTLKEYALKTEQVALENKSITNSEGAGCSCGKYTLGLVTSNGFSGLYHKTMFGLSCSLIAGTDLDMQTDYDYSTACLFSGLESPETIGKRAADRTVKKLNPKKMRSGHAPVVFDPRAGRSLLSYFASSICADSIARKSSFLGDARDKQIFSSNITIIDNPHIPSGLGSCPFDAEGVRNPELTVVEKGIVKNLFSHGASSRQLNIDNNGRASRSLASSAYVSTTNLYIENGIISPDELMSDIAYGLHVTDTIGHGINEVTGDYSIGASGFLIENGVLTYPVSEITIAGNLKEMFLNMFIANDLKFTGRKNVPTLRIEGLMIAGE